MVSEVHKSEARELDGELVIRLLDRRDVALARRRAALARDLGLTDTELLAVTHVAEQGELAPARVAALLDLSSGGVTALVQRLERAGHVSRLPHPDDRRSTLIRVTPATAERLAEADAELREGVERLTARLTEPEQAAVTAFLTQIAELGEALSGRRDPAPAAQRLDRPVPSLWA